ncbi:MAG: hypothetical protein NVS2B15_24830 [Pseudarthrobacter sp.]
MPPCGTVRGMLTQGLQDVDESIARLAVLRSALLATRDAESPPAKHATGPNR